MILGVWAERAREGTGDGRGTGGGREGEGEGLAWGQGRGVWIGRGELARSEGCWSSQGDEGDAVEGAREACAIERTRRRQRHALDANGAVGGFWRSHGRTILSHARCNL